MDSGNKTSATKVAFGIAQRFAGLALPLGFSVGEFVAASKEAFIEAATEDLKKRGIRPTTSRIAVMTGLTRAEVARLREGTATPPVAVSEPRTERVMNAWFTDPEYLDTDGSPKVLPEFGANSFDELVRKHSGDMPRRALLEELISGGMAERDTDSRIRPMRRHHYSLPTDNSGLNDLESAVDFVVADAQNRSTHSINIGFETAPSPAVRRTVNQRTERFLEAISDYLHAEAAKATGTKGANPVNFRLVITHGETKPAQSDLT